MNYYTDVLKKYAVFEGRASRKEFWMFILFNFLISMAISIVGSIIIGKSGSSGLSGLYGLAVFIPSLAVGARRLHDTNRSGWWQLISLIPLIGVIVLIVFLATDSKPGSNEYGPNPKGIAQASVPSTPVSSEMSTPPVTV